jgi:hypothetical protein
MSFGDAGNGAFTQHDTVVFDHFIHGLRKGLVGNEIGHYALERVRAATVADLSALRERAESFAAFPVLGLVDADVAKGGVQVEFCYPRAIRQPFV